MIGHTYYHLWNGFSTYIWPTRQKGTSIQVGAHPTTVMNESHPGRNTSYHNDERFPHIHPGRNTSYHNDEWLSPRPEHILPQWWNISTHSPRPEHILPQWWKISALTFTQARTHPTTMMKGLYTYIHLGVNTSYHNDERALHLHPPRKERILPQWWKGLHSYIIL